MRLDDLRQLSILARRTELRRTPKIALLSLAAFSACNAAWSQQPPPPITVLPRQQPLPSVTSSTPRIQPNASGSGTATIRPLPAVRFKYEFDGWEDDHMHWRAPSFFTVWDDGTLTFKASYLANMKRTEILMDKGDSAYFILNFDMQDSSGRSLWQGHLMIRQIDYKHFYVNVERTEKWPSAVNVISRTSQIKFVREIRPVRDGPPPQTHVVIQKCRHHRHRAISAWFPRRYELL
jgi:hypothetical protein